MTERAVAVVQARLGSVRLPGKVLADLGGKPILAHVIERAREAVPIDAITLTTPQVDEREIREALDAVPGWRPPYWYPHEPPNLLAAFADIARAEPIDVIVRLTADCPLLDPYRIVEALARRRAFDLDYVALLDLPGTDVEVFTRMALERAVRENRGDYGREHVGTAIITAIERLGRQRPLADDYAYHVEPPHELNPWLAVDTPADLKRVRAVYAALDDPTDYSTAATLRAWAKAGRP